MIWFTADTHFNHASILRYCRRPFDNVKDMNDTIIERWNRCVGPRDTVYHLGDFGFGPSLRMIFASLRGKKYLIRGSHDKNKYIARLQWLGIEDVMALRPDKETFIWLSHYPHRAWPRSGHGSWHLHGHSHGRAPQVERTLDVGVDTMAFWPISLDDVRSKIRHPGILATVLNQEDDRDPC